MDREMKREQEQQGGSLSSNVRGRAKWRLHKQKHRLVWIIIIIIIIIIIPFPSDDYELLDIILTYYAIDHAQYLYIYIYIYIYWTIGPLEPCSAGLARSREAASRGGAPALCAARETAEGGMYEDAPHATNVCNI